MSRPEPKELPTVGTVMVDTARSLLGEFQFVDGTRYFLRPIGGGREWDVDEKWAREATPADLSNDAYGRRIRWSDEGRRK